MADLWDNLASPVITLLAIVAGLAVVDVGHRAIRRAGRRVWWLASITRRTYRPLQLLASLVAAWFAVAATTETGFWRPPLLHALLVGSIVAGGLLIGTLLVGPEELARSRFRIDVPDNLTARQAQTQVNILRRVTVVVVGVLTLGVALTTFDGVRTFGATMLASAGIVGVVVGLAAQSNLGNLFAGLQLAFSGALRIDDVATGSLAKLPAVVSAADTPTLWELRCAVREYLVEWIRTHRPDALPRTRAELTTVR